MSKRRCRVVGDRVQISLVDAKPRGKIIPAGTQENKTVGKDMKITGIGSAVDRTKYDISVGDIVLVDSNGMPLIQSTEFPGTLFIPPYWIVAVVEEASEAN